VRLIPTDRAALEALLPQVEAAANEVAAYIDHAEAYYRAENLLRHPQCPDEARARLRAEIERLRPVVARRPRVSLAVQSYMTDLTTKLLKTDAIVGLKGALAELRRLYFEAGEALDEAPKGDPGHERLKLDRATWTITLDGRTWPIKNPQAFKIFERIAATEGAKVLSAEVRKAAGGGPNMRVGQILAKHLPEELRRTIIGQRGNGAGFAFRLPEQSVRNDVQ
jgi:hypothetical protein